MMQFPKLSCEPRKAERDCVNRRGQEPPVAVRTESSASFEEIQKLYSNRLYKRIFSITRNREDAEDALQDTFMRAFVGLKSFQGRSHISTWLTRIATNSALMIIRRRRAHVEISFTPTSEAGVDIHEFDIRDSAPTPDETCDLNQRLNSLFSAIQRLDPASKTALGIWISDEYSLKEMARTLDVSIATIKTRLHRARKNLAKHIDRRGLEPATLQRRKGEPRTQNRAATCLIWD